MNKKTKIIFLIILAIIITLLAYSFFKPCKYCAKPIESKTTFTEIDNNSEIDYDNSNNIRINVYDNTGMINYKTINIDTKNFLIKNEYNLTEINSFLESEYYKIIFDKENKKLYVNFKCLPFSLDENISKIDPFLIMIDKSKNKQNSIGGYLNVYNIKNISSLEKC